jgi:hypothetical protein
MCCRCRVTKPPISSCGHRLPLSGSSSNPSYPLARSRHSTHLFSHLVPHKQPRRGPLACAFPLVHRLSSESLTDAPCPETETNEPCLSVHASLVGHLIICTAPRHAMQCSIRRRSLFAGRARDPCGFLARRQAGPGLQLPVRQTCTPRMALYLSACMHVQIVEN